MQLEIRKVNISEHVLQPLDLPGTIEDTEFLAVSLIEAEMVLASVAHKADRAPSSLGLAKESRLRGGFK